MARGKKKKPYTSQTTSIPKKAFSEALDYSQMRPVWRLTLLDLTGPFGHELQKDSSVGILEKLCNFESMTMHEIFMTGKKQNHMIAVSGLATAARKRLQYLNVREDELVSLRLAGLERVWAVKNGNILSLLWWDPHHQVCPSQKKHT